MSRGCQALGRSGQLRLGADLGLLGAYFRSKPSGLCCRSRPLSPRGEDSSDKAWKPIEVE